MSNKKKRMRNLKRQVERLWASGMMINIASLESGDKQAFNYGGYMIINREENPQAGNEPFPFSFSLDDVEGYINDCISLQTKWATNNHLGQKWDALPSEKQMMVRNEHGEAFLCDVTEITNGTVKFKCEAEAFKKLNLPTQFVVEEGQIMSEKSRYLTLSPTKGE
jgi:hypothetical protein